MATKKKSTQKGKAEEGKPGDNTPHNIYDRLFRENSDALSLSLIQNLLRFDVVEAKKLESKLSQTQEREVDSVYEITDKSGKRSILHLEFQSTNDDNMPYRMASYHALLLQKYKMPIRQVLVYVGKAKYNMQTELPDDQNREPCKLFNVRELNPAIFLSLPEPEMNILAILSHFEAGKNEEVVKGILKTLKANTHSATLSKFAYHLYHLARLRNDSQLTLLTINGIKTMIKFDIDIEEDILYIQGREEGREKGREEGREKGKIESILGLHKKGISTPIISEALNISEKRVQEIIKLGRKR